MTIKQQADAYYDARAAYKEAKANSDKLYWEMKGIENDLIDSLLDEDLQGFKRTDGVSVNLQSQVSISVTQENNSDIRHWLLATVGDDVGFVRETVHKGSLYEYVKTQIEEGKDASEFPDFLKVSTRPTLYVRGLGK